ncbi:ribonuclease T2 family protein [Caulobacter sp. KR2-114]|uniref:ribonuclease T2 family protein n=1 Tax=Caulobacter sp. KR2-114 TaxID=3400912 RepID=UPI003BFE2150
MRWMIGVVLGVSLGLAGCGVASAAGHDVGKRPPGKFDYYVLALSWAQGYCDVTPHPDPAECGTIPGFVPHGLWPQLNGGNWPSNCSHQALPAAERQRSQGIYASPGLITHEWSKHGTCSGLKPAAYFDLTRADVARVQIPADYRTGRKLGAGEADALDQALVAANPGLTAGDLKPVTANGEITEVDICLTKAGAFRSC